MASTVTDGTKFSSGRHTNQIAQSSPLRGHVEASEKLQKDVVRGDSRRSEGKSEFLHTSHPPKSETIIGTSDSRNASDKESRAHRKRACAATKAHSEILTGLAPGKFFGGRMRPVIWTLEIRLDDQASSKAV